MGGCPGLCGHVKSDSSSGLPSFSARPSPPVSFHPAWANKSQAFSAS
jgi:hypothetical protein